MRSRIHLWFRIAHQLSFAVDFLQAEERNEPDFGRELASVGKLLARRRFPLIEEKEGQVSRVPEQIIDDLDRRVLRTLRDMPRATLGEMAEHVGVSRTTFKARLDRLWESGIIIGHETQLDLASMGLEVQAWVQLNVQQGELEPITELLDGLPHVIEAFVTTGGADVQCRMVARSTAHLQELLLELSRHPAVTRTKSSVILSSLVSHRKVQALDLLDL